jgi:hypothetical protein
LEHIAVPRPIAGDQHGRSGIAFVDPEPVAQFVDLIDQFAEYRLIVDSRQRWHCAQNANRNVVEWGFGNQSDVVASHALDLTAEAGLRNPVERRDVDQQEPSVTLDDDLVFGHTAILRGRSDTWCSSVADRNVSFMSRRRFTDQGYAEMAADYEANPLRADEVVREADAGIANEAD